MIEPEVANDLKNRFSYHAPKDGQPEIYKAIREAGLLMASMVRYFCPDVHETSLAITKIEEAVMWANAGVARSGHTLAAE